ncbi:PREDICTED: LOW QUALITY PROTEIN: protease inhibitor HPI-like [Brassica oleracea var. oleracea]|uniref:LOW QUALITY PROTEIN: protease inhibitor HPI-like n=1 Tax=Brassica oleracea var. oleracea TaxID=109376 RepID=UPI0006A70B26|nr:PREDICTED: LOW QUALITY PROTEIN: protease inhibitor HPI-like [Brassica oleracea var. oleracea]
MSSDCPGKNSWPELVGTNGDYAASMIERENTSVDAIVILDGTPVTTDFRCNRVRVRVDGNRIVVRVPTAG